MITEKKSVKEAFKIAIELCGSQKKLAEKLGCTQVQISQWCHCLISVPVYICCLLERITEGKIKRKDMRPDDWFLVWPDLLKTPDDHKKIDDYLEARRLELSISKKTSLQKKAQEAAKLINDEKKLLKAIKERL